MAAAPEVHHPGAASPPGSDYAEAVNLLGFDAGHRRDGGDARCRSRSSQGDLSLPADQAVACDGGVILGERLADRLSVHPAGDVVTLDPAQAGRR